MIKKQSKYSDEVLVLEAKIEPYLREYRAIDEKYTDDGFALERRNVCKYELECEFDFISHQEALIPVGYYLRRRVISDEFYFDEDSIIKDEETVLQFWNAEYGWLQESDKHLPTVLQSFEEFPFDIQNSNGVILTPKLVHPKINKYVFTTSRDFEVFNFLTSNPPVREIKKYNYVDANNWNLAYTFTKNKIDVEADGSSVYTVTRENHQVSPTLRPTLKPISVPKEHIEKYVNSESSTDNDFHLNLEDLKKNQDLRKSSLEKIDNDVVLAKAPVTSFWQHLKTLLGF